VRRGKRETNNKKVWGKREIADGQKQRGGSWNMNLLGGSEEYVHKSRSKTREKGK